MSPRPSRPRAAALLVSLCVGLAGCATVSGAGACDDGQNDPFETFNRHVFAFDMGFDRMLVKPVARAYRAVLPSFVRDGIRHVVDNLKEPLVFVNDLLQGRGETAAITGKRFLINSTVGFAGLADRAAQWGLPRQSGDFGQTLYKWGVGDGPYLVLPLLGPSNMRDVVGLGVDLYASPLGHVGSHDVRRDVSISVGIADGIDLRARNIDTLDELEKSSLDFYAYLRSVTRQQRASVLREATGASADTPSTPADDLADPGTLAAPPIPTPAPADRPASGAPPDGSGARGANGNSCRR